MGIKVPPTSPWVFYSAADANGKVISATVTFDGTNTLTGATVHRDANCAYNKVILGSINTDGSLPAGTRVFDVSNFVGDRSFTSGQLNAAGFTTVSDIQNAPQITVSP